jgi:hypothetical protein
MHVVRGPIGEADQPDWRPLRRLLPDALVETFMWMFEVALRDGRRIHAYKHIETRRYLHIDIRGDAFYYTAEGRYRPIELSTLLEAVLRPWWEELGASPAEVLAAWTAIARAGR